MHSESTWLLLKDNSILFGDRVGNTSERYIPATGAWVADASTPLPLYDWGPCTTVNMLNLPDGNILVGYYGSNQYYIYTPTGAALAAGKPAVDTIIRISCTKYMATGTLFNGISQGSAFGDDWQMATNYPLVRLTAGTKVYYARTYNWNSTGVMRGSAADTTYFDLPSALPTGTYSLAVVANGNPSAGRIFNTCGVTIVPETVATKQKMRVSPNPTGEYATAVFDAGAAGPYTAMLTDVTGRRVLQQAGLATAGENTCTLRLDNLPNGIYIVFIASGEGVLESKLMKE